MQKEWTLVLAMFMQSFGMHGFQAMSLYLFIKVIACMHCTFSFAVVSVWPLVSRSGLFIVYMQMQILRI